MSTIVERLDRARYELDKIEKLARDAERDATPLTNETELVGNTEVSDILGVSRALVAAWAQRGKLPTPIAHLACGRVWLRSDIEQYKKERRA